ncbi:MAG: GIY-YIG nuclease family protein [Leptospiraceae bacterium]|nr:GIY-YIG nuclease family protein [Leptospiraceae bacterium]
MARGIIYILTNEKFQDNIIKIGKTQQENVEIRIQQLNRETGVPFPFECYSAFEIDNNDEILSDIRDRFDRTGTEEG